GEGAADHGRRRPDPQVEAGSPGDGLVHHLLRPRREHARPVAAGGETAYGWRSRIAPEDGGQEDGVGAHAKEDIAEEIGQRRAIRPSPTSTLVPPTLTSVMSSGVPAIR